MKQKTKKYIGATMKLVPIFRSLKSGGYAFAEGQSMREKMSILESLDLSTIVFDLTYRPTIPFENDIGLTEKLGMSEKDIFQNAIIACWKIYPDDCMGLHAALDYLAEKTSAEDLKDLCSELINILKEIAGKNDSTNPMFHAFIGKQAAIILTRSTDQISFGAAYKNPLAVISEAFASLPSPLDMMVNHPDKSPDEVMVMYEKLRDEITYTAITTNAANSRNPDLHKIKTFCSCPGCPKTEPVVTGKEGAGVCSNCKIASYCSKSCQIKPWKEHKKTCKQLEVLD